MRVREFDNKEFLTSQKRTLSTNQALFYTLLHKTRIANISFSRTVLKLIGFLPSNSEGCNLNQPKRAIYSSDLLLKLPTDEQNR